MQRYLNQYYLTTEELLEKSGIKQDHLNKLLKSQCIPTHSYKFERKTIAKIRLQHPSDHLPDKLKKILMRAIQDYEQAALPFDPHYQPYSSRVMEVEAAAQYYGIRNDT